MSGIETIALVASTALGAAGAIGQGQAAAAANRAEANMLARRASSERAASHQQAAQKAKEVQRLLSRQQAVAASSGGGATDETVLDLVSEVAGEGTLQQSRIVAEGEERGRVLDFQSALKRNAAQQAITASYINAGTSIASGVSAFAKFKRDSALPTKDDLNRFYYGRARA